MDDELRRDLIDAVAGAERPLSAKKVRERLPERPEGRRRSEKVISAALAELARARDLHAVRANGTLYTAVDPSTTAQRAIVTALAGEPMTKTRALAAARSQSKLPGSLVARAFGALVEDKEIFLHPKLGVLPVRFGTAPPDPAPYLARPMATLRELERSLRACGVAPDAWRAAVAGALSDWVGAATPVAGSDEDSVLAAMRDLAATKGQDALLSIRQLRGLRSLDKQRFDRALLRLKDEGRVDLHYHDFPGSLAAEDRRQLVEDERGIVYVGAVLRSPA